MNSSFSFTRYASVAAGVVWTLGWGLVALVAGEHLDQTGNNAAWFNVLLTATVTIVGCWLTYRIYPRNDCGKVADNYPREPWSRRISGWFAGIAWCVGGLIWNWGVLGCLLHGATEGKNFAIVLMIPFSVIGWFLLMFLFVCVGTCLDSLFKLDPPVAPAPATEPAVEPPRPPPAPAAASSNEFKFKDSPVLGSLMIIVFLNWFVFAGISIYLGGDTHGILPSRDGFMLTNHGNRTAVSEPVWVFSLFYSTATLLLSPLVVLLFVAKLTWRRPVNMKWTIKLFITVFLLVWFVGWYSRIGKSFLRSLDDWQKLKPSTSSLEPSRQAPAIAPGKKK